MWIFAENIETEMILEQGEEHMSAPYALHDAQRA
jgi:hypothetical protein